MTASLYVDSKGIASLLQKQLLWLPVNLPGSAELPRAPAGPAQPLVPTPLSFLAGRSRDSGQ